MESNTKYAQANLGLNGKIVYKVFNPKTGEVISAHDARATAEKKAKKLGLEVRDEQVNNVRDIAKALNKQTIAEQGAMGEKDLSPENSKIIANAIADEVGYQLSVTAKTGTGLGWYSNNYPKAVKLLTVALSCKTANMHGLCSLPWLQSHPTAREWTRTLPTQLSFMQICVRVNP